jgi:hypothetical protein
VGVEEMSVAGCGFASAICSRVELGVGVGTGGADAVDEVGEVDMLAWTSGCGRMPDEIPAISPYRPRLRDL